MPGKNNAMKKRPNTPAKARHDTSDVDYRIAFVNTHPIQYFAPLYAHLTKNSGLQTTALYLSDFSLKGGSDPGFGQTISWDVDLLDGYESKFMGDRAGRRRIGGFFSMVAPQLWAEIRSGNYDAVIIHGHNLAAHHLALAAAKSARTPVFARGDTNGFASNAGWRQHARKSILSRLYQQFDGVLSIGTANDAHYRAMGVASEKVFRVPYAVDNVRFGALRPLSNQQKNLLRKELGLRTDMPTICFSAKLIQLKRPFDLLAAYADIVSKGIRAQLVIAGSGELETKLRVAAQRIPNGVIRFLGFVNQTQLPRVLAASDIFVLSSEREAWGLAVNEAMCAGLAVIATRESGCSYDLVREGENGHVYAAGDVQSLSRALSDLVSNEKIRKQYCTNSKDIIQSWGFDECAHGIRLAIKNTKSAQ